MTIKGTALQGTPYSAALLQPWIAPAHPVHGGIPVGLDLRTRKVVMFDPWELKLRSIISGMIFLSLGERDTGKSTQLKTLMIRSMGLQATIDKLTGNPEPMRARLHGRKREGNEDEMAPTNNFLRGTLLRLKDVSSLNLFDPSMGLAEWDMLEIAINIAEYSLGRELTGFQPLALQVGVHNMLKLSPEKICLETLERIVRTSSIEDIDAYFKDVDTKTDAMLKSAVVENQPGVLTETKFTERKPHRVPAADYERDASSGAAALNRVIAGRGDYGNTFGGTGSLRNYLQDPMLTLDWNGMGLRPRGLLEAMLQKWQAMAADRNDTSLIPHLNGSDEASEAMTSVAYSRFRVKNIIASRAYHTADYELAQNELQITEAGEEGTELRKNGRQISLGVGARWVFRQPENDAVLHGLHQTTGMSDQDLNYTTRMPNHCTALCIPNRPAVFMQWFITPTEVNLVGTNSAVESMSERVHVTSLDTYRERVRNLQEQGLKVMSGKELRAHAAQHGVIDLSKDLES